LRGGGLQRCRKHTTKLIREWQGTPYEVIVQLGHFEFQGQRYQSLSAIAKAITGTVWNGWLFFGLRARRPA